MMMAGSSAEVSTPTNSSDAASIDDQNDFMPAGTAPPLTSMLLRSGGRCRIFAGFSQPLSSVTTALAPELARRNSSASSPNSVNRGPDTRPARNEAGGQIGSHND